MSGTSQRATEPPINSVGAGKSQLLKWAKEATRSAAELSAACGRFPEVDRAVASHPNSNSDALANLSHSSDKATRARVAANPATPPADLVRLGQQFPKEFLENPALDLLMLENPALLEEAPASLLVRLLKSERCPEQFLEWAAGHAEEKVQLAVAMNVATPRMAIALLQRSHHAAVREALEHYEGVTDPSSLVNDPEQAFLQALKTRFSNLSPSAASEAFARGDIGLAQYSFLSIAARLTIGGVDWCALEESREVPPEVLTCLAGDRSEAFRHVCASNWGASPEMLCALAADDDAWVRSAVAGNPKSSGAVLETLAQDDETVVRLAVAGNPFAPIAVLESLSDDLDPQVRLRALANLHRLRNPTAARTLGSDSTDDSVQANRAAEESASDEELSKALNWNDGEDARLTLAQSSQTPGYVLEPLAKDQSNSIKAAVAANPAAPRAALVLLARKPSAQVLQGLLKNPALQVDTLQSLVDRRTKATAREMAKCAYTPGWILDRLRVDPTDEVVLARLIVHPNASEEVVSHAVKMLGDPLGGPWFLKRIARATTVTREAAKRCDLLHHPVRDPDRRLLVRRPLAPLMVLASNAEVLPSRLHKVIGSPDWLVRAALARHHQTPKGLLNRLAHDSHPLVRALAQASSLKRQLGNPKAVVRGTDSLEPSCVERDSDAVIPLSADSSALVRTLLAPCPNCGGAVKAVGGAFECTGLDEAEACGFSISTSPAGRPLTDSEAESLLRNRRLGPLRFRSRTGHSFNALLLIAKRDESELPGLVFNFGDDDCTTPAVEQAAVHADGEVIGVCPQCKAQVFERLSDFACEDSSRAGGKCSFRVARKVLSQEVKRSDVLQLLSTGRTRLLRQFISNKTGRKFKGYLVWSPQDQQLHVEPQQQAELREAVERWLRESRSSLDQMLAVPTSPVESQSLAAAAKAD